MGIDVGPQRGGLVAGYSGVTIQLSGILSKKYWNCYLKIVVYHFE